MQIDYQNKPVSLNRILNFFAILTIAVSVFIQLILFVAAFKDLSGSSWLMFATGYLFILIPATILAFFGFIRHLSRSFKNKNSVIPATLFLLAALLPVALFSTQARLAHAPEEKKTAAFVLTPYGVAREVVYSEKFKEGAAWAEQNSPSKASQCKGELEFIKGCRNYFLTYLKKPIPAGQSRYEGITTAECKIEVNANYEALEQEYIGNSRGAAVNRRKHWIPELQDCENYDDHFLINAYNRLQHLLDMMKAGEVVTEDEKAGLLKDIAEVSRIRNQPYKVAYVKMTDEYFQRLGGRPN